jgi:hypothetical protein
VFVIFQSLWILLFIISLWLFFVVPGPFVYYMRPRAAVFLFAINVSCSHGPLLTHMFEGTACDWLTILWN